MVITLTFAELQSFVTTQNRRIFYAVTAGNVTDVVIEKGFVDQTIHFQISDTPSQATFLAAFPAAILVIKIGCGGTSSSLIATILSGQSLSGEVDLDGFILYGFVMPDSWDAANLTFKVATVSGGTFKDLFDDTNTEVLVKVQAGKVFGLNTQALPLAPVRFLKIRSGTSAAPVNQTADRVITLLTKD